MAGDISYRFNRSEFKCKCGVCDFDTVDAELLNVLEHVREYFDEPVTITSGCRCSSHNASVGGAKNSQHTRGRAADFVVRNVDPSAVYDYLDMSFPNQYGLGKYTGWCHLDTKSGDARRWDMTDGK